MEKILRGWAARFIPESTASIFANTIQVCGARTIPIIEFIEHAHYTLRLHILSSILQYTTCERLLDKMK